MARGAPPTWAEEREQRRDAAEDEATKNLRASIEGQAKRKEEARSERQPQVRAKHNATKAQNRAAAAAVPEAEKRRTGRKRTGAGAPALRQALLVLTRLPDSAAHHRAGGRAAAGLEGGSRSL